MESNNNRLKLNQIELTEEDNNRCRIRVSLTARDQIFTGERAGSGETESRFSLAALATIDAISSAISKEVTLDLKGINANEVFPGLDEKLIVVVVGIVENSSETVAPGSCRSNGDDLEGIVKATLDATNRIVEVHLQ
jgi:hypothetical protein